MNPKISVILPVYNVEKYLEECVKTIIGQTYQNLEIILVDDGSLDRCPTLCDEFAKLDERIRVLHKKNGGLSDARNAGTQIATGEYITFVDSDDLVTETYVEYLYNLIKKYGCDMSLCTHTVVFETGKTISCGDNTDELLDAKKCLLRMLYHDVIDTSAWAKMYRTDMAKKILYPKGKLFEDIGTTYRFFLSSGKIACGYKSQYFYIQRKNSIVSGKFNPHKLELLEMTDKMAEDVEKVYPDLAQAVLRRRVYARFSTLNQMLDVDGYDKERNDIISFIKVHKQEIMSNKNAPERDKAALCILSIGYPFYRLMWKIFKNCHRL